MCPAILMVADYSLVILGQFGNVTGEGYAYHLVKVRLQQLNDSQLVGTHDPGILSSITLIAFFHRSGKNPVASGTIIIAA
jgi:hypothetical protein